MIICPNLSNPEVAREFNELVQATSELAAYHIWSLNNGNAIDRAPNGAPSKLFLTLLEYYNGNRTKAIQAKAKTYGRSFLLWFGNWTEQRNTRPLVKFYAPTMGKTTAAKSNPNLVDFDDLVRVDIKKLANKLGKTVREVKTESGEEYKQLLLNAINEWRNNPENIGKTLLVSNAVLAKEEIFDNNVSIPSKDVFVKRLVERSEEDKSKEELTLEAELYYDDLISKWYDNPVIENNYVSDLEQDVSKVVDENGEPLVVYRGGTKNSTLESRNGAYYVTPAKKYADKYTELEGGNTEAFFLNAKSPKEIKGTTPIVRSDGKKVASRGLFENPWSKEDISILLGNNDAVYSEGEYMVANPNQIKSVDNQSSIPYEGTYSREPNTQERTNLNKQKIQESIRSLIYEFCDRLGFEITTDSQADTVVDIAHKLINFSELNEEEFNKVRAKIAQALMPPDLRKELIETSQKNDKTSEDIYNDVLDALNGNQLSYIVQNKTLLEKIIDFISDFIDKFFKNQAYYEKLIQTVANQITDDNSEWYRTVIQEGFKQKELDIEKLKESPLYHVYEVLTKLGASLDGSAAVRSLGTLYRAGEEDFHDLDFSKPYDNFSWNVYQELVAFFENYRDVTNNWIYRDRLVYKDLRNYMLENCNEHLKKSKLYKELSKYYSDISIKHAAKTKELGLFVTILVDGNPVDIFYSKDVRQHVIKGIKVTDFSVAFAAKLVMGRDKDIRDIINFHKFKTPSIQTQTGREYTVYQGRTSEFVDGRQYNYWSLHKDEVGKYGQYIRSKTINTTGYLNKYDSVTGLLTEEYKRLVEEFESTLPELTEEEIFLESVRYNTYVSKKLYFDILNNSERGMRIQNAFWEFLLSKGYKGYVAFPQTEQYLGLDLLDLENPYIVEFDTFLQVKDQLKSLGEELMNKCKG